jgi:hypothetical protein
MDEKRNPLEDAQSAGTIAARDKGHDIIERCDRPWRIERDLVYVTTCVKCGAELAWSASRGGGGSIGERTPLQEHLCDEAGVVVGGDVAAACKLDPSGVGRQLLSMTRLASE